MAGTSCVDSSIKAGRTAVSKGVKASECSPGRQSSNYILFFEKSEFIKMRARIGMSRVLLQESF